MEGENPMEQKLNRLYEAMVQYDRGDAKRIQHFVKVHSFARLIGTEEGLSSEELLTLEAAALVHDIGIRPSEEKYGDCSGKHQEEEGPGEAEKMLRELGYEESLIERVCYLVGHHHTYDRIDGMDYQILVEADFLVNLYEDGAREEAVRTALARIFRTTTGSQLCRQMFGI